MEYKNKNIIYNVSKSIPAHVNIQVQYYTKQNVTRGKQTTYIKVSKSIPAHVNIQVQYYTKQNVTRGIQTTYINGKCINI